MAQIKILKINSAGWQEEHGSSDELSMATYTASGSFDVTSGVSIGTNITFNAATDTIAGVENQNLVDKTAIETISANWTIATSYDLTITDAPTNDTDAANKAYVDSVASGLDWQDSVLDRYDPTSSTPSSPSTGDRYISTATANGWTANNIYEWNGSTWDATTVSEGMATWVEDENIIYVYNGTAWVKMSSVYAHNELSGLQGGVAGSYYHMSDIEHSWLQTGSNGVPNASNLVDKTANETISGNWTYSGENDYTTGEITLPNAASGTPGEGDVYWDGSGDTLYVYNGAAWQDVSSSGTSLSVQNTYTGGAGGIAQYDVVYISSADTVSKADASVIATAKVIGFAPNAITAASTGAIQENGVLAGVISGATAGTPYFLSTTAGDIATARPSGSGEVVYKMGYAKNTTDLQIQLEFIGIRS